MKEQLSFLDPPENGEECIAAPPVWPTLNDEQRIATLALLARLMATQMTAMQAKPPNTTSKEKENAKDE